MKSEEILLKAALRLDATHEKALASYLFREVIEDAHVKYGISQDDMKSMCKRAVDRAALFLEIREHPKLYEAFAIHALEGTEWDDPQETDDVKTERAMLESLAGMETDG